MPIERHDGGKCIDPGLNRGAKQQEEVEPTMPLDVWGNDQADKRNDSQLGLQEILG